MSAKEIKRLWNWRLGIICHAQEVSHNVVKTCRYYGISRSVFYKWLERYEKPQPGHRIQIDVKFLERVKGTRKRYYQFTAIDDCTRLRVMKIFERNNQKSAIQFLDYVLSRLSFKAEVIQTDNGSEFQEQFHWHVLGKSINHVYIKLRRPRLNGKVERSHLSSATCRFKWPNTL